jgi:hypothetical protein
MANRSRRLVREGVPSGNEFFDALDKASKKNTDRTFGLRVSP